ncbi:NADH-quinone oxidoreductase subunit A [Roseivirga echinicomitans]|uniref:NADH-quinone oxidoreductase subunit A n=1 Tax=Roseivirga echinicomitans TaxID=296218 RepID=A0A150XX88_9BACT|nr:NADH-quinone oxidoreductase subunit A [Roseivirga echinicomitans]KYG83333.1 NADH dehydrogenase [Roseivirga echinicomitans]
MIEPNLTEFGTVLIFILGAITFVSVGLIAASIIRPKKPNYEKLTTYESGEETIGNAWGQFNIKFYIVAIIFLLFEVEIIYLFPWAVIFGDKELIQGTDYAWAWFAITEMFIFIFILALGLAYAWRKCYLDWVKPVNRVSDFKSPIPTEAYQKYKD